ncbi:MAG: response regulator [Alphaproteobacteria bacterium]|nr:response regulator [Alphaproteobacteria bacterium]
MSALVVHIVDDDEALRDSLQALLEGAGFSCAVYPSAAAFLADGPRAAGCALVDVRMPGMDGLTLLREIAARHADIGVVIMTGFADVPLAVKAMREGAIDFVEKPAARDVLVDAVRRAFGKATQASQGDESKREALARFERLTEREREVLDLLVLGDANKVVAHKLGISPRTVEIHRGRLMEKTQAKNLAELVRMALAAGIGART